MSQPIDIPGRSPNRAQELINQLEQEKVVSGTPEEVEYRHRRVNELQRRLRDTSDRQAIPDAEKFLRSLQ